MEILEALKALDPSVDDHWTGDGAPRVDVVSGMVGRGVARSEITDAAPTFTRETLDLPGEHVHPAKTDPTDPPDAKDDEVEASAAADTESGEKEKTREPEATTAPPAVVAPDFEEGQRKFLEAGEAVAAAQRVVEDAQAALKAAVAEQARWQRFAPRTGYDHREDQDRRMKVIRASTAARAARAAARGAGGGAPVAAPIDQAMGRPASRPGRRPMVQGG